MKYKSVILFAAITAVVCLLLIIKKTYLHNRILVADSPAPNFTGPFNKTRFYNEQLFNNGIIAAQKIKFTDYKVAGAVASHHDLISPKIAEVVKQISKSKPKTIIIIGPNHYEHGPFKVTTCLNNWDTPIGIVQTDSNFVRGLMDNNLAQADEEVVMNDHATTIFLPYIKNYAPEASVVQLLIKKSFNLTDAKLLSDFLAKNLSEDMVLVASLDFSHYLTAAESEDKDLETMEAINKLNYPKLLSFNSDHMDSPGSLVTLLMTMQKSGKTQKEILYHGNSSDVEADFNSYVTSYYSILFH